MMSDESTFVTRPIERWRQIAEALHEDGYHDTAERIAKEIASGEAVNMPEKTIRLNRDEQIIVHDVENTPRRIRVRVRV